MVDQRAVPPTQPPLITEPPRLLLADDDAATRRILAAALKADGFAVTTARDGAEALTLIERQRPDLVVLDFEMPERDGAEVCASLRAHDDTALREVPVIMLTGHADEADEVACLEAGANDFVTKPASRAALGARIRTQLRLRALSDELRAHNTELTHWRESQEADLHAARATQRTLLPSAPPDVPGWHLESVYQPVIQVGGDVFGWRRLRGGKWLLWLADAAGHGVAAALLTAHVALLFNHAAEMTSQPAVLLDAVNREFREIWHGRLFFTALAVVFDPRGGMTVACAGHPPLLIKRADGAVESHGPHGTMLGILPELGCTQNTLTLAPGDFAVAYTDGLFSLREQDGERMRIEGVESALHSLPEPNLSKLIRAVHGRSKDERFDDDLAAVSWRRT